MEIFKASVQYNDMTGTAAADRADFEAASDWLREREHMSDNEFLVGIKMFSGENHNKDNIDPVFVTFLITDENGLRAIGADSAEYRTKRVDVDMGLMEFMALFKRFNVSLSSNGCLEGKPFNC